MTATFVTAVVSLVPHVSVVVHHLVRKTAFVWLGSGLTILLSVMATGRRADLWAIDAPEGSYR